MFNKPNTVGFLHVSHYLSSICDKKLFKQMVKWPILSKKDEATYRVEMKDFLCHLSRDNPDLNFPSILITHLLQSGGTKFQIIMWKLSQLALRTYMKKEFQGELLNAPRISPIQDLIITYFNNTIAQKYSIMTETHKKMEETLKAAYNFFKKNKEMNELEESCNRLCKLVSRINSNSGIIEANKFPEICYDNLVYTQCEVQHLIRNYANGSVVFSTLLSLLHFVFVQILHHENVANFSDLSQCLPFVQDTCKQIKSLRTLFSVLNTRIGNMYKNEQCRNRKVNDAYFDFDASNVHRYILLQSPKISFNFNQYTDDSLFYEKLCSSPMKDKHKHLFKKYKRKYRPLSELPATLSDFSKSWNSMSGWLSPRAHSIKCGRISFKGKSLSPLYFRLLHHSKLDLKRSRGLPLHLICLSPYCLTKTIKILYAFRKRIA
ncbi:hypothetical protein ALC62_00669 [Cyphomyrmex costatus]|uniref:HAUS augmin-like complex subunit 6 N-terminal domain-containing protein n=1 Tax=Cyphomyrmex costatus TaxID=456900 RepID=A0A151IQE8_9HYME|nr:hypothetical protein ALC62_00669 [Cyphomyrmex costatus]